MRWALAVGKTPRELLACVTSDEITEMMGFERLEPFGALQEEYRAGIVAATLANVNRDPKTNSQPYLPSDFMPALQREVRPAEKQVIGADLTPEQLSALINAQIFGVSPTVH